MGTPLTGASNAGGVGRNRDSEPISGLTVCVNAATVSCQPPAAQRRQVRGNRPGYCKPASVHARHRLCSGGWSISVNLHYSEVSRHRTGSTADFPRPRHQCRQVLQLPHSSHQTYPPPAHSVGGPDVSMQFGKQLARLL